SCAGGTARWRCRAPRASRATRARGRAGCGRCRWLSRGRGPARSRDRPSGPGSCVRVLMTRRALLMTQRALLMTQRALLMTQRALLMTQRALLMTQRAKRCARCEGFSRSLAQVGVEQEVERGHGERLGAVERGRGARRRAGVLGEL